LHSRIAIFLFLQASLCLAQPAAPAPSQPAPEPRHETVVVTGTFEPLSLDEIDRDLVTLPVRTEKLVLNTLADVLKLDPTLDLQERAPGGIQTDVSIRGGSFEQTLVLVDGLRMDDAQSGHHDMDIPIPLDAIDRVEVLQGAGSPQYGSDAVGGVINIITAPPEGLEIRLRTAAGNDGINQQRVSLGDSFGGLSEQLTFARDFSTGFTTDRDYRNLDFASTTHLASAWGASDLILAYMDHPFGADQFYGPYPSWEDTKTWLAGFRQTFGSDTEVDFAYRRHSDLFVLYRDDPEIYTNHHADQSWQAAFRRHKQIKRNVTYAYGVEGLHESIVSNNLGIHARSRSSAYAALDFRALRRFSLSLAAREEVYRTWSAEFTPTVAGGYWLSPHWKLRASVSRAFRVPTYTDLYYEDPANLGNPNLRPERAWSYESGVEWNPASRVRADLTVFQRRLRDGIDYYRASPADPWQALNIDSLNFTGVESALHIGLGRGQTLDLRYDWLLGMEDTVPIGETKYTFNYPTDSAVVAWQGSVKSLALRTRLGVVNRRGQYPYALWDVSAAYTRGRLHPFLQLSNLTNTGYQEIQGVPMPGRTAIGGLEWVIRGQ
jgi:iron complex outermembrane receptor protein